MSPSKSMKTIGQPYQAKTMANMNKFSEDRTGCKSVMSKKTTYYLENQGS